ncbi:MAG: replication initiator protein A [Campylobacter sp.]|uniref:hypothetical protein n=1 Tax=Campylobacter sp. TaxID=205 RepID=UPI002AA8D39D|nr:hypothetical protein [Campylobacter sp.]MCI7247447.1 replication initiator protein A [Campylobacter sp.]
MSYFKYYFDTSDLKLSLGAEKLLNIFRDRYELSAKKGFTGKNGNVVFLIKLDEIATLLGKSARTAFRMVDELREKGLISTQKRQSGILEFSLNVNFNLAKNGKMDIDKNGNFHLDKNGKMIHISQTKQARLTKPNARMRTKGSEQNEPSQNERASSHHFSQSELGNSRIPSGATSQSQTQSQAPSQAQDKPQEPKATRQWLGINDKPSYISEQVWQDFCAYKRERRHNFTATGKKAFFAKLDDIQAKSGACEQAIKNTMANGWQGVFMPPLDKRQGKGQSKGQAMQPAQMVDALQDWLSDREAQVVESELALPSRAERGA